jgi:AcrR family transcriptional regulator
MSGEAKSPAKYRTPLREAQREQMRSRILSAARGLFYDRHYDTSTMDDIAAAAGIRRSTLYLHYRDKAEILLEVITDYGGKATSILATLPGPEPSRAQVRAWVGDVADFIAKERAPLSIIIEVRRRQGFAAALDQLTSELLESLGANNPTFRGAGAADANPTRQARALMLLQVLTYACEVYLENTADPRGQALLDIAAEDFHAFLASPRGAPYTSASAR